jgi:HAD superfamily hydrolase (TIGR01484 family)
MKGGTQLFFFGHEDCYSNQAAHPHVLDSFQYLQVRPPVYHPKYWMEGDVPQAMLYCLLDEEERFVGKIPDVDLVRWHKYSMDVIPSGGSKAEGIRTILKHLGIDPMEAAAFGDGLNDKEMLSYVGMGIAMGNAHEELKPFCKPNHKACR